MSAVKEVRTNKYYFAKQKHNETGKRRNVREMIECLNMDFESTLKPNTVTLTHHSVIRVNQRLKIKSKKKATQAIRELLKGATRIGDIMSRDGRISVLYYNEGVSIYLTPDLKKVVTVNNSKEKVYPSISRMLPKLKKQYSGEEFNQKVVDLHKEHLARLQKREEQMIYRLGYNRDATERSTKALESILLYKKSSYDRNFTKCISEERYALKQQERRLFDLKCLKRTITRSMLNFI